MSDACKDVKFMLKVMVNKEETKVLFAEVDSSFADVLLSFLTLPLGTIARILKNHYGDEAPAFGSLTTLYNSIADLDSVWFWTEGAKSLLLHPRSTSEVKQESLRLDITDSPPVEYFVWTKSNGVSGKFRSVSMYWDKTPTRTDGDFQVTVTKEVAKDDARDARFIDGVFTKSRSFFVITDDMQIVPIDKGLLEVVSSLGITEIDKAELMNLTFGYTEVMDLLVAMLISSTPLSDIVLNRTGLMNSKNRKCEEKASSVEISNASTSSSKKMILKVMLRKSTNQFLYALAGKDFIEFLFSFLIIPLGGVERLFAGNSHIKSVDSLYTTIVTDLTVSQHFTLPGLKNRLIKPKIPHGSISENHIFPLIQEDLPSHYKEFPLSLYSENFPQGQANYLREDRTFLVTDDLTVTPFCIAPALSIINRMKVPLSDVKEVEMQIGLKEALGILRASLTSTSALSDGLNLINHASWKQPRQEY